MDDVENAKVQAKVAYAALVDIGRVTETLPQWLLISRLILGMAEDGPPLDLDECETMHGLLKAAFRPPDAPGGPTTPAEPVEASSGDESKPERACGDCARFDRPDCLHGSFWRDICPELPSRQTARRLSRDTDASRCGNFLPKPESEPELPCDTCLHWKPDEAKGHRLPSCPIPLGASCFSCRACRSCTGYEPKPAPDCETCTGPSVVFDAAVVDEPKPESDSGRLCCKCRRWGALRGYTPPWECLGFVRKSPKPESEPEHMCRDCIYWGTVPDEKAWGNVCRAYPPRSGRDADTPACASFKGFKPTSKPESEPEPGKQPCREKGACPFDEGCSLWKPERRKQLDRRNKRYPHCPVYDDRRRQAGGFDRRRRG